MLLYWAIRQKINRIYFIIAIVAVLAAAIESQQARLWKCLITAAIFIPLARGVRVPSNLILRCLAYCGQRLL